MDIAELLSMIPTEAWAAIGGGAATGLVAARSEIASHYRRWQSSMVVGGLKRVVEANEVLRSVCADTGGVRALVISLHNGGGMPSPTRPVYVTIVSEWVGLDRDPVMTHWQSLPVDQDYLRMTNRLYEADRLRVVATQGVTEAAPESTFHPAPGSMLYDTYAANGIPMSEVWPIGVSLSKKAFYYVSVRFDSPHEDTPLLRHRMRSCVTELQSIMRLNPVTLKHS